MSLFKSSLEKSGLRTDVEIINEKIKNIDEILVDAKTKYGALKTVFAKSDEKFTEINNIASGLNVMKNGCNIVLDATVDLCKKIDNMDVRVERPKKRSQKQLREEEEADEEEKTKNISKKERQELEKTRKSVKKRIKYDDNDDDVKVVGTVVGTVVGKPPKSKQKPKKPQRPSSTSKPEATPAPTPKPTTAPTLTPTPAPLTPNPAPPTPTPAPLTPESVEFEEDMTVRMTEIWERIEAKKTVTKAEYLELKESNPRVTTAYERMTGGVKFVSTGGADEIYVLKYNE